jgi:3-isopropylmalate/(R)-2-methylmalate dehydratase small subunit
MNPVTTIEGRAYPFGRKNVDTDVIIPARLLKTDTLVGS